MSLAKQTSLLFLLLIVFISGTVKSQDSKENSKEAEEIEHIFDEIEADHNKLRKVFKQVVFKETPPCKCVPFYLCKIAEGKIITDGEGIIRSRVGEDDYQCENSQDVCCMPPDIGLRSKILTSTERGKCGFGVKPKSWSSDNNQPFAEFGEFPWTVMIINYQESSADYKCVGSLIHPQVVLTAAHCVEKTASIIVRAGEWNTKEKSEPIPHQTRLVNDTIKHPSFKLANLKYNVALLITEQPFDLDENVNTACLSCLVPQQSTSVTNDCVATGWGADKPEGKYSDIMRKMKFLLISDTFCEESFRNSRLGELFRLHPSFLCAFNKYSSDTCEGNGGAPLVCPVAGQPGRYEQVGLTSWGIGCAGDKPSVFTNIPEIKPWIDEQFDELGFSKDYYTYDYGTGVF